MSDKPKVLVIEDGEHYQKMFAHKLEDQVELLQAFTRIEAQNIVAQNPDIDLIVLDGQIPRSPSEKERPEKTIMLVDYFRYRGFEGEILAYSMDPDINKELLSLGCAEEIKDKFDGPDAVIRYLSKLSKSQ